MTRDIHAILLSHRCFSTGLSVVVHLRSIFKNTRITNPRLIFPHEFHLRQSSYDFTCVVRCIRKKTRLIFTKFGVQFARGSVTEETIRFWW